MKTESKIQLGLAVLGMPLLLLLWKPDAKWPNPFRSIEPKTAPKS